MLQSYSFMKIWTILGNKYLYPTFGVHGKVSMDGDAVTSYLHMFSFAHVRLYAPQKYDTVTTFLFEYMLYRK